MDHDAIPLEQMPQQTGVRTPGDDWTGLTSPAERRKLQNRINQRLYRQRHGCRKVRRGNGTTALAQDDTNLKALELPMRPSAANATTAESLTLVLERDSEMVDHTHEANSSAMTLNLSLSRSKAKRPGAVCNLATTDIRRRMEELEESFRKHMAGSPKADHLFTLIQFNVFRALLGNDSALGFKREWLDGEASSPFNNRGHGGVDMSCPSGLRPTTLQHTVPHHPWIDLFPIPTMRDNILRQGEDYDDTPLCLDLVDFCDSPGERTGLIVWGDPWDPNSWEISEEFLKKWGWVIKGCYELFKSTNYWRAKRGEKKLFYNI